MHNNRYCGAKSPVPQRIKKTLGKLQTKMFASLCCCRRFVRDENMRQHSHDKHGTAAEPTETLQDNIPDRGHIPVYNSRVPEDSEDSEDSEDNEEGEECEDGINFDNEMTDTDLNRFIAGELQPDQEYNKRMNSIVDKIYKFLSTCTGINQKEIIKGGSLGKSTAIRGNADIDLVIVLHDVASADELRDKLPDIKTKIKEHFKQAPFSIIQCSFKETTFSVQFTIKDDNEKIKVDLLPTFHFTDKDELYKKMVNEERALLPYYSAALSKLQVCFVKAMLGSVKNLIRLVKYWNKNHARNGTGERQPTSYAMELITISVWQKAGSPSQFEILQAFRGVMERLRDVDSMEVIWEENYSKSTIPHYIKRQRPLLMDPANPTNNVCKTYTYDGVKEAARRACESTLLKNVSPL